MCARPKRSHQHAMTERYVSAETGDVPFLVRLRYAFKTDSDLHLVMGEYIKNYAHGCKNTVTPCAGPPWAALNVSRQDV
jgi:hypothetical protein